MVIAWIDPSSDEKLLADAGRGDGAAFAGFYRRHMAVVLAFLRARPDSPLIMGGAKIPCFG